MADMNQRQGNEAKLPVWNTFIQTYSFVFSNLGALFRVGLIPMAIYSAITFFVLVELQVEQWQTASQGIEFNPLTAVVSVLALLPVLLFVTAWHRFSISHDLSQTGIFSLRLGKAEFVFLGYGILIYAMIFAMSIAGGVVGSLLSAIVGKWALPVAIFVIICVTLVLLIRLTLVFPAAAIGASAGLKDSWRATRGSFWRMLAVTVLVLLPQVIVMFALGQVLGLPGPTTEIDAEYALLIMDKIYLSSAFNIIVYWFYVGISIAALSFMYKFLTNRDERQTADITAFD